MLFLAKLNKEDRDNVLYIDENIFEFSCGHYFSRLNVEGSCFSRGLEEEDLENIKYSLLSDTELRRLFQASKQIDNLGYSIKKDVEDERYIEGLRIKQSINDIIGKLQSSENEEYFNKNVLPEEIDRLKSIGLTSDEILEVFEYYPLEYRDSSIVGQVYDNLEDMGREEAFQFGYTELRSDRVTEHAPSKYILEFGDFDYEEFADDLLGGESYHEFNNGKIVYFMM